MTGQPRIRSASLSDAAAIAAIYAPYVVDTAASFEIEAPSAEVMGERIERLSRVYPWLVAEDEVVIGYGYAGPFRERPAYHPSVEVSVYLATGAVGRGIGSALLTALLANLRERGFANALAGITLPNDKSVRMFERAGFENVGTYREIGHKLGAWHDVGWWQLRLQSEIPGTSNALM